MEILTLFICFDILVYSKIYFIKTMTKTIGRQPEYREPVMAESRVKDLPMIIHFRVGVLNDNYKVMPLSTPVMATLVPGT